MADDQPKPVKRTVTNLDQGPRFVHALGMMTVVPQEAAITASFTPAELDEIEEQECSNSEAPRFDITGASDDDSEGPAEGTDLSKLSVSKLRKMADGENVQLTGRTDPGTGETLPDLKSAADIAAAIEAKRTAQ